MLQKFDVTPPPLAGLLITIIIVGPGPVALLSEPRLIGGVPLAALA